MMFLLKRVTETAAKDLLLTARILGSDEAFKMGLINMVVPAYALDNSVNELVASIMKNSLNSIKLTKEMFRAVSGMSFENALAYACDMNAITRMTDDCKAGIAKFLNKNK